ncbi:hypothetical protein Calag_0143 [Caldisphaera lagunensis DSM 15908]|uniref:AMP-binding enzyme C-terminal domain-containing protein n=2 Tax=Caldisphaera lagunensis TaxID=200415 RepID=L0AA56_CALLD|nr:hypothetical protein Calag_0143 [Caldisphaera lagunensis DSM 15908]
MAYIVPNSDNVTAESIIDYCIERMPSFWIPSYIIFVQSLPKTPLGRTEKYKLRVNVLPPGTKDMHDYIKKSCIVRKDLKNRF